MLTIRIIFSITLFCFSIITEAQIFRYQGVINDTAVDRDFANGHEAITTAITNNLNNLNLYEYAHALPELYSLIENGKIKPQEWRNFIDSLEQVVKLHNGNATRPLWAVDYTGLIPLQTQFFLASVNSSKKLNQKYPTAFKLLVENTSGMSELGYREKDYDSLLIFSEVVGETNFWFFLQIEDCYLIGSAIKSNKIHLKKFQSIINSLELVSTYKTPYYLQKRKIQSLKRRLLIGNDELCVQAANALNSRSIMIMDRNMNYFAEGILDGVDKNKTKIF